MNISEFQKSADATDVSSRAPWVGLNQNIFGLFEKLGGIAGAMKNRMRDKGSYSIPTFRAEMERQIGEAMWYLSAVATHFNIDLEQVAVHNLNENRLRWGMHRDEQGNLFSGRRSASDSDGEAFPSALTVEFTNIEGPNLVSWLPLTGVTVDGIPFGDPVDDNSRAGDGYRFHDVLHFAFACHLSWSPVVRRLLKNKRKSDPMTDKFDDGARARDTEEAVSNMIHHYARANNFFVGAKHLDTEFLYSLQAQVIDLEVRDRTAREWESCILTAYDVFRKLVEKKGGYVDVNFESPKLTFRERD